jgi:hypothetical protein
MVGEPSVSTGFSESVDQIVFGLAILVMTDFSDWAG